MAERELSTRREFLGRGLTLAAAAATVPSFLSDTAFALDNRTAGEAPPRKNTDQPILVVVQLAGGNDGLNTVVPYADDAYHRARPTLAVKADQVLKLTDRVGLHPNLKPLKALYDAGGLAIVQGVGYPNPNRSHFRSMEIWETAADSDKVERYGWIGRYFDHQCAGAPDAALAGLRVGRSMPQAFTNGSSIGVSLQRPEQYRWHPSDRDAARQVAVFQRLATGSPGGQTLDFLQRTALNANLSSAEILELAKAYRSRVAYPDSSFAASLKTVAQMIAGGLGTRVYYVTLGGFDTHAQQEREHPGLLDDLGASLSAFLADLKEQGNLDRVVAMAFSEFGRRVQENGSGGTDHGAAGLMLLAGGPVKAGLHGTCPSLTELDRGDLKFGIDFRSVYATVLDGWLKAPAEAILGRKFAPLKLLV